MVQISADEFLQLATPITFDLKPLNKFPNRQTKYRNGFVITANDLIFGYGCCFYKPHQPFPTNFHFTITYEDCILRRYYNSRKIDPEIIYNPKIEEYMCKFLSGFYLDCYIKIVDYHRHETKIKTDIDWAVFWQEDKIWNMLLR